MSLHYPRYKENPHLVDTTGFFDYYVPFTNQSQRPANDSVKVYYNFSIYDYHTPVKAPVAFRQGPTIFTSHELKASSRGPIQIQKQSSDWIALVVVTCLLILAWIQTNYSKRLKQIIRSMALPYYVNQLEREGNLFNERITLGLGFIYLSSVSLLIYQAFSYFGAVGFTLPNYLIYLIIFFGLSIFIILKMLVIQISGIIFKTQDIARAYRLNAFIFDQVIGIALFPVLLLSLYCCVYPIIWIAIGIISILLTYRLLRSIIVGLSGSKFPVFYLILYLCTLEILPILILIKVIRQI